MGSVQMWYIKEQIHENEPDEDESSSMPTESDHDKHAEHTDDYNV